MLVRGKTGIVLSICSIARTSLNEGTQVVTSPQLDFYEVIAPYVINGRIVQVCFVRFLTENTTDY